MGNKITIDSATLINKGFEVIEAHSLFNLPYEKIDVIIQRESIIHSMVEFDDNSVMAQMAVADMRLPIQYAVCCPDKKMPIIQKLNFSDLTLTFSQPDIETFRLLPLATEAGKKRGTAPAALNAANEAAVGLFLANKIKFLDIEKIVEYHLNKHSFVKNPSIEDIIDLDKEIKNKINLGV